MTSPSPASAEPINVADPDDLGDALEAAGMSIGVPRPQVLALSARVVELEAALATEKARNAKLQDWQNEYQESCDIIRRSAKLLDEAGGTPYLVAKAEAAEASATAAESLCNSYRGIAEQQSDLLGQERARATALLEALLEALRPFAKEADTWHDTVPDSHRSLCSEPGKMFAAPGSETTFTVGDLRAARAAINARASNDRK